MNASTKKYLIKCMQFNENYSINSGVYNKF